MAMFAKAHQLCCFSVLEVKEAFNDIDVEIIMDLYEQSNRNKQVLFEMCFNLANPDQADPEALREAMQNQDDGADNEEERDANYIAELAHMQMGSDHGPMTQ